LEYIYCRIIGLLCVINWKGCLTKWSWPNRRHYSSICLEEQRKTTHRIRITGLCEKIWTWALTNTKLNVNWSTVMLLLHCISKICSQLAFGPHNTFKCLMNFWCEKNMKGGLCNEIARTWQLVIVMVMSLWKQFLTPANWHYCAWKLIFSRSIFSKINYWIPPCVEITWILVWFWGQIKKGQRSHHDPR
jgi:hypothetical protein